MKVREEHVDLVLSKSVGRSKGLHMSEVIRSYALTTGVLDRKYDVEIDDSDIKVLVHLGMAFEDYLAAYQHPEIHFHPGEMVLNGIAMSPDGMSFCAVGQDWVLHEFKLTLKSSREFRQSIRLRAKKTLMYMWQIMCYRFAMNKLLVSNGQEPCYKAKLHVMFLRGNYARNFNDPEGLPTYKVFTLIFTPEELEDNWSLFLNHAREMGHKC